MKFSHVLNVAFFFALVFLAYVIVEQSKTIMLQVWVIREQGLVIESGCRADQ